MNIAANKSRFSVARKAPNPALKIVEVQNDFRMVRQVINLNGNDIGFVEKFHDDACTIYPWKAFIGIGFPCKLAGFFYKKDGGRNAAIAAVVGDGRAV
jgi:hypothetical protein